MAGAPRPSRRQGQHGAAWDTRKGPASGPGLATPSPAAQNLDAAAAATTGTVRAAVVVAGRGAPWRPPSAAPSRSRSTGSAAARSPPGDPTCPSPAPAQLCLGASHSSPFCFLQVRRGWGRRGGCQGRAAGHVRAANAMAAAVGPLGRRDRGGVSWGPSWRQRCRENRVAGCPPRPFPTSWPFPGP